MSLVRFDADSDGGALSMASSGSCVQGAPWRDLPECFGPITTCYNRLETGCRMFAGREHRVGPPARARFAHRSPAAPARLDRMAKPAASRINRRPGTTGKTDPRCSARQTEPSTASHRVRGLVRLRCPRRSANGCSWASVRLMALPMLFASTPAGSLPRSAHASMRRRRSVSCSSR